MSTESSPFCKCNRTTENAEVQRGNNKNPLYTSVSSVVLFRSVAGAIFLIFVCLLLAGPVRAAGLDGKYRKAQKEIAAGNFDKAEGIYKELLDKDPKDIDAILGLSFLFLKERDLDRARVEAERALTIDPQNARAQALFGTALLREGELPTAVQHLRSALLLNIREDLALASAAELDLYENRVQEAFQKVKLATSRQPEEPDYWLIYARAASRLEQFRDAADALRRFLRYAPKTDSGRRERIEGVIKFYTYLGNTNIYQINGKTATVPLKIKLRRPYLVAKVNGKGTLRFVIDTGSGVAVISTSAAQRLGIREIARGGRAHAVGGEGTFPIIYGLIDDLEIGGIKLSTVPVYIREIHSPSNAAPEDTVDGLLGLSVLSNFLVTLDYRHSEMRLDVPTFEVPGIETRDVQVSKADSKAKANAEPIPNSTQAGAKPEDNLIKTTIPFRMTESGLISVEGRLDDDATLNFIFDSGASTSVISSSVVDRQNWQKKILDNEIVRIVGAAGITENVKVMYAGKLQVADLLREHLRMPVLNFNRLNEHAGYEQQGILGGDFLHQCRVQIDFRRLQLELTLYSSSALKRVSKFAQLKEAD
jgi:tetratricopeptide (TPR) repeat protein